MPGGCPVRPVRRSIAMRRAVDRYTVVMFYELWDVETGNIIGDFDTKAEAFAMVRELLSANSPNYAAAAALGRTGEDGQTKLIAEGAALAAQARDPDSIPRTA